MSYNCANLTLANPEVYDDPNLYAVTSLENRNTPIDNLPEGWSVILNTDINFEIMVTIAYSVFNCTNAVIDENNKPQYLVGEFFQ